MKVVMIVCAKCGFQNDGNAQKCTNCLIDLHWAKVNLGEFQGSEEDTRRIGIEARKARGIPVPENGSLPLEPVQIQEDDELPLTTGAKVGVVIVSTIIGAFFAIVGAVLKIWFGLYGVGLPTWLGVAFLRTPVSGAFFFIHNESHNFTSDRKQTHYNCRKCCCWFNCRFFTFRLFRLVCEHIKMSHIKSEQRE
jgi:hypothetical protein